MVGFAGALIGGAMSGWSKGQLENIKTTREEKLRQLELDRAERMETRRQEFQHAEGELTRTAQATQAREQLAATKELTLAELKSREGIVGSQITSTEKIAGGDITSREKIADLEVKSRQNIADSSNKTSKEIADADRKSREALAGKQGTLESGEEGIIDPITKAFSPITGPDGKPIKLKPDATTTSGNVQDMSFLMSNGVSFEDAKKTVFESQGKSAQEIEDLNYRALLSAGTKNFGDTSPEELEALSNHARALARGNKDAAAPSMSGGETGGNATAPTSAIPRPKDASDEALISDALASIKSGKSRSFIRRQLQQWGVDQQKIAKAGL